MLIGKRVVTVSEAAPAFLSEDAFKSITGDLTHTVNPKNKTITTLDLPVLFFMFSNREPSIDGKEELIERIIDCRMTGVESLELMTECDYQELLKEELPEFIGYCLSIYAKYRGHRIPCDYSDLMDTISAREEEATDIFHKYFIVDKDGEITGSDIRDVLYKEKVIAKFHRRMIDIFMRRFGIKRICKRDKQKNTYSGLRFLTTEDKMFDKINIE
jgi:hypothetical protein